MRVAESPVSIECTLHATLKLGDSTLVLGRVVQISVWEEAVRDGRPRIEQLRPLARLGGNEWSTIGEVKEIRRIPFATWTDDPSIGEHVRGE
jgi:flavin reductase (DIM6/NTAB) family NADH-FMN oxidoreductase RutF